MFTLASAHARTHTNTKEARTQTWGLAETGSFLLKRSWRNGLDGEGRKEEEKRTVVTSQQQADSAPVPSLLASLCHQGTGRRGLGSLGVNPAKLQQNPQLPINPPLTLTLTGSSVWVNNAPFDIPTVRQIWGCQLTWFWLCGIPKDSRGAGVALHNIYVAVHVISDVLIYPPVCRACKPGCCFQS